MSDERFWRGLDALVASARLVIDRPAGTAHPRYTDFVYPLDYGYLDGTTSADGGGIDAWRGSLPAASVTAVICTLDLVKRDSEIKILLGCTSAEAETILRVHNDDGQSAILIARTAEDASEHE